MGRSSSNSARVRAPRRNTRFRVCLGSTNSCRGTGSARESFVAVSGRNFNMSESLPCNACIIGRMSNGPNIRVLPTFSIGVRGRTSVCDFVVGGTPVATLVSIIGGSTAANGIVPTTNINFGMHGLTAKRFVSRRLGCPAPVSVSIFCASRANHLHLPRTLNCNRCRLVRRAINNTSNCILSTAPMGFMISNSTGVMAIRGLGRPRVNAVAVRGGNRIFTSMRGSNSGCIPICGRVKLTSTIFNICTTRSVCALSNALHCDGSRGMTALAATTSKAMADRPLFLNGFALVRRGTPRNAMLGARPVPTRLACTNRGMGMATAAISVMGRHRGIIVDLLGGLRGSSACNVNVDRRCGGVHFNLCTTRALVSTSKGRVPGSKLLSLVNISRGKINMFATSVPINTGLCMGRCTASTRCRLSSATCPMRFGCRSSSVTSMLVSIGGNRTVRGAVVHNGVGKLGISRSGAPITRTMFNLFGTSRARFTARGTLTATISSMSKLFTFGGVPCNR